MNFKRPIHTLIASIVVFSITSSVQAESPFSKMKDKLKSKVSAESNEQAKDKVKSKTSSKSLAATAGAGSSVALGSPSDSLTSLTKCASVKPSNIIIGSLGDYTFQQGFTKEKRSGLINRNKGSLSKGCILPSLQSRQVAYMEVDTKSYEALGSSNDWEMQCLKSANLSAGAVNEKEPKGEYPYHVKVLSGKDMLLFCGNSENIDDCGEGSNSSRSGQWDKKLDARGKTMLSVMGVASTLAPAQGEKLYCQYYNKKSGKSLFAFEYLRVRG